MAITGGQGTIKTLLGAPFARIAVSYRMNSLAVYHRKSSNLEVLLKHELVYLSYSFRVV
jgi:hypothetical protein